MIRENLKILKNILVNLAYLIGYKCNQLTDKVTFIGDLVYMFYVGWLDASQDLTVEAIPQHV